MADDASPPRRAYADPPSLPSADLVEGVAAVVASRDEVVQVRLRTCIDILDGTEISRRPQLAVLLRDQPEATEPAFRRLTRELAGPLDGVIRPHGGTVNFSFPAARRIFERCGYIVFARD
jgi:hypothetical protein